jgi:O-antigen/teichoic acid export membrane protein
MAAYKGFESISDIYQGFLQQRERMDYVAGSFILKGSLALCALWSAYYATHSLFCAVTSMAGAQLLTLVAYDIRSVTTIASGADWTSPWNFVRCVERPLWNRTTLMSLCVRALPLGIAMMMLSLYANVPRFVLSKYAGPSAVGIFAAISYVSMIGGMLVTAVGTAVAPRMSQYAAAERAAFYGLVAKLAGFAALLGVLGVAVSALAGQWLLSALYGSEYGQYPDVLVWSMIAAALLYLTSAFGFSATAQGRIAGQPWAIAISTSVLISVAVLLVPRYGLTGAAIATVISSGVSLSCFLFLVFRRTAHDVQ